MLKVSVSGWVFKLPERQFKRANQNIRRGPTKSFPDRIKELDYPILLVLS